ncbi:MAG: pyridoxal phosphate-dependent aminotransferase [Anaerolineales bacterium]|nr:pyridoxal phosphate-dependent aminotransferase [Anaerolineales bacterium]
MQYDFDRVIDRRNSDSIKWSVNEKLFGSRDVISAWIADMDFESPAPVIEALRARAAHVVYGYPIRPSDYYDSLINWMQKRHHWEIKTEWLTYSPGVVPGLALALHAYTQPGDKIVIQPPVYPPFFSVVKNNGRQLVFNPLQFADGKFGMDLENLERQIDARTRLLILCNPHNPVGRVWTRDELTQLGELCLRKNVLIVSDEIHCDLILRGAQHVPFASLSDALAQNTITLIAPSKTFNIPGLYTAAAIISNARLRAQFNTARQNWGLEGANIFGLAGFEAAYRDGEEWLDQLLAYLQGNVEFLLDYFEKFIPRIKPIRPEGTYLVWLDCRGLGLDDAALKEWMRKQARVAMNEGNTFGDEGRGFVRLNFGCPRAVLVEALQRIQQAVRNLA